MRVAPGNTAPCDGILASMSLAYFSFAYVAAEYACRTSPSARFFSSRASPVHSAARRGPSGSFSTAPVISRLEGVACAPLVVVRPLVIRALGGGVQES